VRRISYRPAEAWREAPRAKRALRKIFGISMPFCLIPCPFLLGSPCHEPRGALRAQNRLSGARFARMDAC
jgi:hypothetical protein